MVLYKRHPPVHCHAKNCSSFTVDVAAAVARWLNSNRSKPLCPSSLGFLRVEFISSGRVFFDLVMYSYVRQPTFPCHLSFASAGLQLHLAKGSSGNPIISHLCKQPVKSVARRRNVGSSPSIWLLAVFLMSLWCSESTLRPAFVCLHAELLPAHIFVPNKYLFVDALCEKCSLEWWENFFCWPNWSLRSTTQPGCVAWMCIFCFFGAIYFGLQTRFITQAPHNERNHTLIKAAESAV